jgi:predicted cation transporter
MTDPTLIQIIGAILFALAVVHTFSTKFFEHLAHTHPNHAGIWHLLGEVEVVFGFWAMVLMVFMLALSGRQEATTYLDTRNFSEPLFVFAIMVVAGTRPILQCVEGLVKGLAQLLPVPPAMATYFVTLSLVPLMGSLITEPAAMTLAALILRDTLFSQAISTKLKYTTIGILFVNISIGGTLTPFAAPPVLMVAAKWNWDFWFMLSHIGWKAAVAVCINAAGGMMLFRREIAGLPRVQSSAVAPVPASVILVHIAFLALIVIFSHHTPIFIGLLLFFLGFATAYQRHQNPLILREALMVAFFLGGLVVLGGMQQWWLQRALIGMDTNTVYIGATLLTAITDNAALTYLGSLVEGLAPDFKLALVMGAVTGGGLTVIANAPNPAGMSILRGKFDEGAVHPLGLLLAAIPPTLIAVIAFRLL